MKKLILLIALGFIALGKSQTIKIGQRFVFTSPASYLKTDTNSPKLYNTDNKSVNRLDPSVKYKIVEINKRDQDTIITVMADPQFKTPKKNNKINNDIIIKAEYYNNMLFDISKKEYLKAVPKNLPEADLPDRINVGILSLPFKYRAQGSKSYDSDFNLNSTLAVRIMSLGGGHLYAQIGAGIGGVELTQVNSKGISDEASIKANALSMLSGLMVQYKKVQAGIYLGTDFINNQSHYQWEFQGKPWIAFGVGYQLFNVGLGQDNKTTGQTP